jgi:hypothetical protein
MYLRLRSCCCPCAVLCIRSLGARANRHIIRGAVDTCGRTRRDADDLAARFGCRCGDYCLRQPFGGRQSSRARAAESSSITAISLRAALPVGEIVINVPQRMLFYRDGDRVLAYPVAVGRRHMADAARPIFAVVRWTRTRRGMFRLPSEPKARGKVASCRSRCRRSEQPPRPVLDRFEPRGHWHSRHSGSVLHLPDGDARLCPPAGRFNRGFITAAFAIGTRGRIIYEPVLMAANRQGIYLEVHRDVYRRATTSIARNA